MHPRMRELIAEALARLAQRRATTTRVTLREVAARDVAVLSYSGTTTPEIVRERTDALRAALEAAGLTAAGPAVSSRYDPPSTLPMLRRNEIWIPIAE